MRPELVRPERDQSLTGGRPWPYTDPAGQPVISLRLLLSRLFRNPQPCVPLVSEAPHVLYRFLATPKILTAEPADNLNSTECGNDGLAGASDGVSLGTASALIGVVSADPHEFSHD